MSKFCGTCGATLADNASFCTTCGASQQVSAQQPNPAQPVNAQPTYQQTAQAAPKAPKADFPVTGGIGWNDVKQAVSMDAIKNVGTTKNKLTLGIVGGAAIIVLLLIIFIITSIFGGASGYEKPLASMCKAMEDGDVDDLLDCFADKYLDVMETLDKDYEDSLQDNLDDQIEELEDQYGKGYSISYKILDKERIDEDDLEDYEGFGLTDITDGYTLDVKITIDGDDDSDTNKTTITVLKIDGDWSLSDMGSIF